MLDLIIITGASKGIGKNIANSLFDKCYNMLIISSSDEIMNVNTDKCNLQKLKLDLTEYNQVESILNISLLDNFKNVNNFNSIGIVLCGAQLGLPGGLLNTSLFAWENVFNSNVLGNLAVIKSCLNHFGKKKIRIVFFAGGGAAFANPEFSAYSLSKVSVVRAVENLDIELKSNGYTDSSIVALAPGAVQTDMLDKVIAAGAFVRTKTDISEPTNFVNKFLLDKFNSLELSGKFLHVRDDVDSYDKNNKDIFKLRRIQ